MRITKVFFLGAAVIGCGEIDSNFPRDDQMQPPQRLCDEETQLLLTFRFEPRPTSEFRGSTVRVENGYPALIVDSSCNYWMNTWDGTDALGRDRRWRKGKIDAALEADLAHAVSLGRLDQLADCVPTTSADGAVRTIRSAASEAACVGRGERFEAAWSVIGSRVDELWATSIPLSGSAVRASAVRPAAGSSDSITPYSWPLEVSLASFLVGGSSVEPGDPFAEGISKAVEAPGADKLRAISESYLAKRTASPGLFVGLDGMLVTDGDTTALVYLRDSLPYEDSRGLVTF